jgi:RimJ/RimL family protein N-acetyltransferase
MKNDGIKKVYNQCKCDVPLAIETERFLIRSLTIADASERYLSWFSTDATQFIANKASDLTELKQYIQYFSTKDGCWLLGIFTRDEQIHIGNIKFECNITNCKVLDMGILIGEKNWQGKGVAKEVIEALGCYFKNNHDIESIQLGVDIQNTSAIKAYQKSGFEIYKPITNLVNRGYIMIKKIN